VLHGHKNVDCVCHQKHLTQEPSKIVTCRQQYYLCLWIQMCTFTQIST